MRDANFEFDRELLPDNIERSWSQLMMLFQVISGQNLVASLVIFFEKLFLLYGTSFFRFPIKFDKGVVQN